MNKKLLILSLVILLVLTTGCTFSDQATLIGIVTSVDLGKDGVQVELQTEDQLYSVTISKMQTDIVESFDQIIIGAEIEVSGEEIAGMDLPLIVADSVRIINSPHPLTNSNWILTSLSDQKPINYYQPTLQFEVDRVSGTTGCNHYGGIYHIEDDTIRFDGVFSTEMACVEPEGMMDQELIFLETLRDVVRFSLTDRELVLFTSDDRYLEFSFSDSTTGNTPSEDHDDTVSVESPTEDPENLDPENIAPPWEFNLFQDSTTGISIYIPQSWIVTGIVDGEYAIFQSFPEDRYVGGEPIEEGDTKCDLIIQTMGMSIDEVEQQIKSSPMTSILSEEPYILNSGQVGNRLEIDSMGKSISFVSELSGRVVSFTCFGDFSLVDEIALTIFVSE